MFLHYAKPNRDITKGLKSVRNNHLVPVSKCLILYEGSRAVTTIVLRKTPPQKMTVSFVLNIHKQWIPNQTKAPKCKINGVSEDI